MKLIRTIGFLLIFALLCSTASAAKELPTEKELNEFLDTIPKESGFASAAFDASVKENPTWPVDLWDDDTISFYHEDGGMFSKKGYASKYFDNDGQEISGAHGIPVKSYTGNDEKEDVKEDDKETEENTTEENDDNEDVDDNESEYTYEAFDNILDQYDGKTTCSSRQCAKSLSEWLNDKGWDTSVMKKTFKSLESGKTRYCVKVKTEDEGNVYVILG